MFINYKLQLKCKDLTLNYGEDMTFWNKVNQLRNYQLYCLISVNLAYINTDKLFVLSYIKYLSITQGTLDVLQYLSLPLLCLCFIFITA